MSLDTPAPQKPASPFKKSSLAHFEDVSLYSATLHDLVNSYGRDGQLDFTTSAGNRIICDDTAHAGAMKRTRVFFGGSRNTIHLGRLTGLSRLDIACVDGSEVTIGRTEIARGVTIMASQGARIRVGNGCMLSRDIIIYASRAHALYNSADGRRREQSGIEIGDKVWLGQGVKVLGGARVGNGSVIGSYSVLAGKIPNNCAAAGNPCRVTTKDIFWTTRSVGDNYFRHLEKSGEPIPPFVKMTETT